MKSTSLFALLSLLAIPAPLSAQISITGPYSENFDTALSGNSTVIPTGWALVSNGTAATSLSPSDSIWAGTANGTGYNAALQTSILATGDSVSDRCLAVYASGAAEVRHITATFVNNTGAIINQLAVNFQIQASAARFDNTESKPRYDGFRLLIDPENDTIFADTAFQATITNAGFAFAGDANYTSGTPNLWNATANGWATGAMLTAPGANTATVSGTITGLSIANGATFKLRWNSFGGGTAPTAVVGHTQLNMNIGVDDLTITPTLDTDVPLNPTGLAANALNSQSIHLTWSDNSSNETGFKIQRSLATGGPWSDLITTAANVASYTDTGLSPSTPYYYRVFANNLNGDSVLPTNEASATTTAVSSGTVQLTSATYSVSESGGIVTVSVARIAGGDGAISVDYATSDGTATTANSDYVATSGTLNWADGDSATKTFNVTINNDIVIEPNEDFTVTLTNPISATLGTPASAAVTITNDDSSGTLQLMAATYGVSESGGSVTVSVSRTAGLSGAVSVDYATSDGTATTANSDYVAASGTLNWADGDNTIKTFNVTINNDIAIESNEDFSVTLSNAVGGTLGSPASAAVTITNDDSPGALQLTASTYSVSESGGAVSVSVSRATGLSGAVSIDYATSDGTATTADSDYVAASGTLNWADGDNAAKTFNVTINNDSTAETNEIFNVTLSNAGGGATLGTPASAAVTITNDDFIATAIVVTPASTNVIINATKQFSAVLNDQNGQPIAPQPTFTWSVTGGGTINSSALFTATSTAGGPYTVSATAASLTGNASVTVETTTVLFSTTFNSTTLTTLDSVTVDTLSKGIAWTGAGSNVAAAAGFWNVTDATKVDLYGLPNGQITMGSTTYGAGTTNTGVQKGSIFMVGNTAGFAYVDTMAVVNMTGDYAARSNTSAINDTSFGVLFEIKAAAGTFTNWALSYRYGTNGGSWVNAATGAAQGTTTARLYKMESGNSIDATAEATFTSVSLAGAGPVASLTSTSPALGAGVYLLKIDMSGKNGGQRYTIDDVSLSAFTNTAPTITGPANQSIDVNTATSALALTIGDAQTTAASLTLTGASSNQTLVPDANIAFGGSGANRTVTVTPAANQTGTATITVTVSDGSLTAQSTFDVTVNPVVVLTPAEQWRQTYFGSPANSGDGADGNDFDKDGLVNLLERAFKTIPNDASSSYLPVQSIVTDGGSNYLAITYRQLTGGTGTNGVDYTVDGMKYTVEYDADLVAPWTQGGVTIVSVGAPVSGVETVTVRLNTSMSAADKQFIRLAVSSTP